MEEQKEEEEISHGDTEGTEAARRRHPSAELPGDHAAVSA
jgi:hypothetical protein